MTGTYYFEREHPAAYAPVRTPCYSKEQALELALELAEHLWQRKRNIGWKLFRVTLRHGNQTDVVRDYL